jgi:hypothetical protein
MLKTFLIALTVAFSVAALVGCRTVNPIISGMDWPEPSKPIEKRVNSVPLKKGVVFTPASDGIFLDKESAANILFNVDELDVYIAKQIKLIEEIKDFYNAK